MVDGFPIKLDSGTRQGHFISEIKETREIHSCYRRHKSWILTSENLYSGFDYPKLLTNEIQRHDLATDINQDLFFRNKILTSEVLSQLIKINLKNPIEAYLELKHPLPVEELLNDIEATGERFLGGSIIDYSKIRCCLKKYVNCLSDKETVLNQLALLKHEDPKKYYDMIMTGILNYAIESQYTDNEKKLKDCFVGGLLHDIGFLYLDARYRKRDLKQFTVVDLKKIQNHAELGYHLLKAEFNDNIINAAINHHIGEDKTGYPRQMAVQPNRLSSLTCFASSFVSCLRKHKLHKAVKIQEIYSRKQSHYGDELAPFFKRDFYNVLENLDLKFNQSGTNVDIEFNRKYSVALHNFLVYIDGLNQNLERIDDMLLDYIKNNAAHRLELQDDVDDIFDHIKRLNIVLKSCGKTPGLRKIMKDDSIASGILSDIEIIFMELHRNNRFLIGLFSYLNSKIKDTVFESTVYKKALIFSKNIQQNISSRMNQGNTIFDLLSTVEI